MNEIENNKLIAEFYGAIYKEDDCGDMGYFFEKPFYENWHTAFKAEALKFHTSWDWLMPVVEKIEGLSVAGIDIEAYSEEKRPCEWQFTVSIENGGCTIHRDVLPQYGGTEDDFLNLYSCLKDDKLKSTYEAVITFINWYNTTKN